VTESTVAINLADDDSSSTSVATESSTEALDVTAAMEGVADTTEATEANSSSSSSSGGEDGYPRATYLRYILERNEAACKYISQLQKTSNEEDQLINKAINTGGKEFEYGDSDNNNTRDGSMCRLQPKKKLTDPYVKCFLDSLARRNKTSCGPGRKRSHFFNSYFIQSMFDEKNTLNPSLRGKYNYKNVKRWGKKVPGKDIFKLDRIYIPINIGNVHWALAIIYVEAKIIRYFDSCGFDGKRYIGGLLQYLKMSTRPGIREKS